MRHQCLVYLIDYQKWTISFLVQIPFFPSRQPLNRSTLFRPNVVAVWNLELDMKWIMKLLETIINNVSDII